ncbi:MAG: carboxylating nicotinate-nucleotide diphosphorylase [Clostridia bacterium]|nr:carboxylating nicotinate-nucleotide diphosphorylase [Clostridia bacterium]
MQLLEFYVDDIIKRALLEDINYIDVASDYLLDDKQCSAYFIAKAEGVLCGIDVAMRVFEMLDPTFKVSEKLCDGAKVKKGDIICRFSGNVRQLLKGERTALNLIQHMSGIATATNALVRQCEGTKATVAETRKTLPGLRVLQKYAVVCGGGKNHRFNLSDCAMLKDNHIDAYGSITGAVNALRKKVGHTVKIEVETRNLDEVKEAVAVGAEIIMLDNMSCDQMKQAVDYIDGRAVTEASGNMGERSVHEVALTGVDIISFGSITHSVKAFDISMRVDK